MAVLNRYSNFIELKSANNLTKNPDLELFKEYKIFIELLVASVIPQKEKSTKSLKNKKKNG